MMNLSTCSKYSYYILLMGILVVSSCNSKPKVIIADSDSNSVKSGVASVPAMVTRNVQNNDMHEVVVEEILQAERYTYLKVKEKSEIFWIATTKLDAKVGETYLYQGGLLKTDFESVEHKRTFDKIYLVSEIINANAHPGADLQEVHNHPVEATSTEFTDIKPISGVVKLSDLITHKQKYQGKKVVVAGKCVKANYGIMNRNWYHIQDGTKNGGKTCDLTITSNENIPLGANIAFEGKLVLNKDFGAGYVYEIIIEDGKLK